MVHKTYVSALQVPRSLHREHLMIENRNRPRVLIADDHKLVAEACETLLEPEFDVVGTLTNGRDLMQAASELLPDVVILDISMPQLNGLDAGEQVKRKHPATKIIYLTMLKGPDVIAEAFRRGASGYVLKHCDAEELLVAVRGVLKGESYLSPTITKDAVNFLLQAGALDREGKRASGRHNQILQLLAEGKTMKEVAWIMKIKPGTVAYHKYQIMNRLGITTNAELVDYAVKHHMISE
jgi:DNA-binding NarL/FixJ family response regulator